MAEVLNEALRLTDPEDSRPVVKLIPESALSVFEDLESSTGDPTPLRAGQPRPCTNPRDVGRDTGPLLFNQPCH